MYHEEKVINGVLCWRGTPDGEWTEFTKEQLTQKLLEVRQQLLEDGNKGIVYEPVPWWMRPDNPPTTITSDTKTS